MDQEAETVTTRNGYGHRAWVYLRDNGPTKSRQICTSLGIEPKRGIQAYIKRQISSGRILKLDSGWYAARGTDELGVDVPTLWQILTDLQQQSIDLRTAYRLAKAHVRAVENRLQQIQTCSTSKQLARSATTTRGSS